MTGRRCEVCGEAFTADGRGRGICGVCLAALREALTDLKGAPSGAVRKVAADDCAAAVKSPAPGKARGARRRGPDIAQIERRARELGMSYGRYVAEVIER